MVALRDEIGEARLEDVPALVAQMERLQGVSLTRADLQTMLVDPASPYFGHLRLREEVRGRGAVERDVLIGRATFVDAAARINIVDWRHAPVSQLFYRYAEGSDYEERFGDRDVEGEIVARRIAHHRGRRADARRLPAGRLGARAGRQATITAAGSAPTCRRTSSRAARTHGASPSPGARRAGRRARGPPGAGPPPARDRGADRSAPVRPDHRARRGVVVIQGGAGSGKTTVGLHRLAYLAHTFPEQLRAAPAGRRHARRGAGGVHRPAAAVAGRRPASASTTFRDLAERGAAPPSSRGCARASSTTRPPAVTRVKSHPALLHELERLRRPRPPRQARLARRRRAVGGPAHRSRRACSRCCATPPRCRSPSATSSRRTASWPTAWRPSSRAIRARAARAAAAKKKARAQGQEAAHAAAPPARRCTGPRWGSQHKPGQRTVDSDLPEGIRRVEGDGDRGRRRRRRATTIRTSAARPASTACAPTTTCRCWTRTTSRSCCAPASCCAARSARSRTCSSTRRRTCRR